LIVFRAGFLCIFFGFCEPFMCLFPSSAARWIGSRARTSHHPLGSTAS
jgi:hypothetical protein